MGCQPWCAPIRHILGIAAHQLGALLRIQFLGQGQHELIRHPAVRTAAIFRVVEKVAGTITLNRHAGSV
jgi:hypothetical protein